MNRLRPYLLLLVALICGLVAVLLAGRWLNRKAEDATVRVVVAQQQLPAGERIAAGQLSQIDWPARSLPAGALRDPAKVVNRVPRVQIEKGEPVLEVKLTGEGVQAGLAGLISEGKRAVSVKVTEEHGVAGFARPGNYVDVMGNTKNSAGEPVSRIILERVLVLASAQDYDRDEVKPKVANAVTLEVTPEQATMLDLARNVGTLSLVMRNPVDNRRQGDALPAVDKRRLFGNAVGMAAPTAEMASSPGTPPAGVERRRGPQPPEVIRGIQRGQDAGETAK